MTYSLLLQEFCGGETVRNVPLPASVLETELKEAETAKPTGKGIGLVAIGAGLAVGFAAVSAIGQGIAASSGIVSTTENEV